MRRAVPALAGSTALPLHPDYPLTRCRRRDISPPNANKTFAIRPLPRLFRSPTEGAHIRSPQGIGPANSRGPKGLRLPEPDAFAGRFACSSPVGRSHGPDRADRIEGGGKGTVEYRSPGTGRGYAAKAPCPRPPVRQGPMCDRSGGGRTSGAGAWFGAFPARAAFVARRAANPRGRGSGIATNFHPPIRAIYSLPFLAPKGPTRDRHPKGRDPACPATMRPRWEGAPEETTDGARGRREPGAPGLGEGRQARLGRESGRAPARTRRSGRSRGQVNECSCHEAVHKDIAGSAARSRQTGWGG